MLVEFSGGQAHLEDSWEGDLLEVGDAVLRVGGPIHRCAAPTRDPGDISIGDRLRIRTEA